MSTRCNIVIKKKDENNTQYFQLYHHCDGYPEGVGRDIHEILNGLVESGEFDKHKTPSSLGLYIHNEDDSYEVEGNEVGLHGDIEYLYVVDMGQKTITCYEIWLWDSDVDHLEYVEGTAEFTENYKEVYTAPFNQDEFGMYYTSL